MRSNLVIVAALLLGVPVTALVNTDGRPEGSIPKLEVPQPPEWKDVEHPVYEPYPVESGELEGAVLEQFDGPADEVWARWQTSKAKRNGEEPYTGEWALEEPTVFKGFEGDIGLVLKSEQKPAAIARKLEQPIDNTGKTLVLQYEVKLQQPLRCGGAYLKVLPETDAKDWSDFGNDTPYLIMFGPDRCGATDKVHFILRRGGKEHHLVAPPRTRGGLLSSLYTLILHENQDYEIRVDGIIVKAGSLIDEDTFDPPLNPPREIDDPKDKKPKDWVEDAMIPDPSQPTKPADWDEEAPYLISDPSATKPEAWKEDTPVFIPDPDASKPAEWDDEEDGEWSAPEILNPECRNLNEEAGEGCGPWEAPLIRNPDYKGKWVQPLVENPAYKGEWSPRKIPNPDYVADDRPSDLDGPVGGLGYELWTVQGNILFDNLYIGHSVRDAENIGNATWSPKYYIEIESQKRATEAHENAAQKALGGLLQQYKQAWAQFRADPVGYSADTYNDFIDFFRHDPISALTRNPVTAMIALCVAGLSTALVFGLFNALLLMITGRSAPQTLPKKDTRRVEVKARHSAQPDVPAQDEPRIVELKE